MMVLHRREARWEHAHFADLPAFLRAGDVAVVNNTKVIPARLIGRKPGTGGKGEVFLLEETAPREWDVLVRARRRPRINDPIVFGDGTLTAVMLEEGALGRARVRFETERPVVEWAEELGETPLPPYIQRKDGGESGDRARYQTVYAQHPGAVAAPTAGLHFTPEMFERLAAMGIARAELTLHVGIGTFRPVSVDTITEHRMEAERYQITGEAAALIQRCRERGGRCLAVGSTSVRTLEEVFARHGTLMASEGRTDLFIYPPFTFRAVDAILTNFHLPKSTLLMMMSAFAGRELMLAAYEEAVRQRYRFFSYGDCMLIV